jgi:hypothetical protein
VAIAHEATLPARVREAVARDVVMVRFDNGSALPRPNAERFLAAREERQVDAPLRRPLDEAVTTRDAEREAARTLWHTAAPAAIGPVDDLTAFLRGTAPLVDEVRGALVATGGGARAGGMELLRSLDLPNADGLFGDDLARALTVPIAMAAAAGHTGPRLARIGVPRDLAGVVVCEPDVVRVGHAPCLRRARHARLLEGLCRGVIHAALAPDRDVVGHALALGLYGPACRRVVLGRREDAGRIAALSAFLDARAAAAVAVEARASGLELDALRDALVRALGDDVGRAAVPLFAPLPWPDGVRLDDPLASLVAEARARAGSARWATALRDRHDEAFPHAPALWEDLRAGFALPTAEDGGAAGWTAFIGAFL